MEQVIQEVLHSGEVHLLADVFGLHQGPENLDNTNCEEECGVTWSCAREPSRG